MIPDEASHLELRDYLRILRRRKLIIIFTTLVVAGVALASSMSKTPVYAAHAQMLLQPRSTESLFDAATFQYRDPARAVQTEIQVLTSEPVTQAVLDQLGFLAPVSASGVGLTDVISVRAESISPEKAAAVANAYATSYIDFRRKQAVDDILAAGVEIQARATDLEQQIVVLDERLRAEPDQLTPTAQSLASQKDGLVDQLTLYKQKLDELKVGSALKTGGAQLVSRAGVPGVPFKPTPKRTTALAGMVGLLFGVGLAFLREYLDDSIKSKEDLERAVHGTAVIGLIPVVPGWKTNEEPRVVSITETKSSAAEAYRTLRTSIQFLRLDQQMHILQVTSASAGEGKTTTMANLGVALANAGQQVVMVCCDLRRPRIHKFFGLSSNVGFTSVLLGDSPLQPAIQRVPGMPRLQLLASGPLPPNPSEMLGSHRAAEVFAALKGHADVVLIDSPPALPVTDALVLSRAVDATLLVCAAGGTSRKEASRAAELLRQVDANLIGTVLNGVTSSSAYGDSYQYYRTYTQDESKKKPKSNGEAVRPATASLGDRTAPT